MPGAGGEAIGVGCHTTKLTPLQEEEVGRQRWTRAEDTHGPQQEPALLVLHRDPSSNLQNCKWNFEKTSIFVVKATGALALARPAPASSHPTLSSPGPGKPTHSLPSCVSDVVHVTCVHGASMLQRASAPASPWPNIVPPLWLTAFLSMCSSLARRISCFHRLPMTNVAG